VVSSSDTRKINLSVFPSTLDLNKKMFKFLCCGSVLLIRIGFNSDPDPEQAFYVNADQDPGSQTNADPDPSQTLKSKKLNFFLKNMLTVGNM
jgi:hypothetical protein